LTSLWKNVYGGVMPTTDITPEQLRKAARWAWRLDALLDKAQQDNVMPLMVGFDLDYLAAQFKVAAKRLEDKNA